MTRPAAGYVAIVLAAGASRRMGGAHNKLLEPIEGVPMVARVVDAFVEAGVGRIVVVVGHEAERVRRAFAGRTGVECVLNADWQEGMGRSLATGVRVAIRDEGRSVPGILVSVGDLPGLSAELIERVCAAHAADPSPRAICLPVHAGRAGHPVLFGRAHLPSLALLGGDRGARAIVEDNAAHVRRVPVDTDRILRDVDTPDDLSRAREEIERASDAAPSEPCAPASTIDVAPGASGTVAADDG